MVDASAFAHDYQSARVKFIEASSCSHIRITSYAHPQRGRNDEVLFCDTAWVGSADAPNIAVMICGTHGLEGLAGSAVMVGWLRKLREHQLPDGVAILLVHAINPWGFSHLTRTTERNVDLNRNFVADYSAPSLANALYDRMHSVLRPKIWDKNAIAQMEAAIAVVEHEFGRAEIYNALRKGQYNHSDGLNFGGASAEWSNLTLKRIVSDQLSDASKIGFIDWHTGIGPWGEAVFLCFNEDGGALQARAGQWWGTKHVIPDAAFSSINQRRPEYRGLLFHGLAEALGPKVDMAGAVIEFGTHGTQVCARALRRDLWLKFETDKWAPENSAAVREIVEAYYPQSDEWRAAVLEKSCLIIDQMVDGLTLW